MSRSSSATASPDAPPEEARAAAQQPSPPVATEAGDGVSDAPVPAPSCREVEHAATATSGEDARALRSSRRQERNERPPQSRRTSPRDYGEEAGSDAVEAEEDVEERSCHSLLLFVLATAILVVCIVAGFVSIAILEQIERRKKQPSIEAPDFD